MNRWRLARRDLLRTLGLGAGALPLLHATRALGQPRRVPRNLICVQMIHGYRMASWKPASGSLMNQTLPSVSAPLEPHKADLLFVTELSHLGGGGGDGGFGTVFWGKPAAPSGGQWKEPAGKTLDQVVADGAQAPFVRRSLALGVQLDLLPHTTVSPGGNFAYWNGAGQPVAPMLDPRAVYQLLFGNGQGDLTAVNRLRFQRKSVLDYVGASLQRFSGRVGTEDKRSIAAHLDRIRELEKGLDGVAAAGCGTPAPAAIDLADQAQYANVLDAQLRLMVAALACGVTRVTTLQLSDATGTSLRFGAFVPGVPLLSKNSYKTPYRNWADLANNPIMDGTDHKALVDAWFMGRFSELITRMKAIPDPAGGTLFDQSIILWANVVEEGASKNGNRKPWILAARSGGPLRTGQHLATAGQPTSGVLAAVCEAMNVPHSFGAAQRELLM
jgi:hypothetical protein